MGSSSDRNSRVPDEDILLVLREADDPVLSTAEVADRLPIERRSTLNRLRSLEEQELVESKQIGGRNTVWWLSSPDSGNAIPEDDPFFSGDALFASGDPVDEEEIDDIVYGNAEG